VAALGFLEPEAGRILGVPKSWQRGGTGAYHRLRRPVLRTLDEMNAVLCQEVKESSHSSPPATDNDTPIWMRVGESSTTSFPFSAEYMVPIDDGERQRRKKKMKDHYLKSPGFDFSIPDSITLPNRVTIKYSYRKLACVEQVSNSRIARCCWEQHPTL
jgi:hypothetical protein